MRPGSSIGGVVDYARLAEIHRPTDHGAITAEIRRLYAAGWTARDIAASIRIDLSVVLDALAGAGQ